VLSVSLCVFRAASITGVFNANPDGDLTQTTLISGVINYQIYRTGPVPADMYPTQLGTFTYEASTSPSRSATQRRGGFNPDCRTVILRRFPITSVC
jgi:hypothetical protein